MTRISLAMLALFPLLTWGQTSQPDSASSSLPASSPSSQPGAVVGIEIRGNIQIPTEQIREKIKQLPERELDVEQVTEDLKEIYKIGGIADVSAALEDNGVLVFTIQENPPIDTINFTGDLPSKERKRKREEKKLRAMAKLRRRDPLDFQAVKKSEEQLKAGLQELGYHFAEVETKIEFKPPPEGAQQGSSEVTFHIKRGPRVLISKISFVGNEALNDQKLKEVTVSKTRRSLKKLSQWRLIGRLGASPFIQKRLSRGLFLERQLNDDILRLQARYYDEGYVDVALSEPKLTFNEDKTSVEVEIEIEEGARYKFGGISFSGEGAKDPKALAQKTTAKEGDFFNRSAVSKDASTLSTELRDKGYGNASALPQPEVDKEKREIDIDYSLTQGELVYIRRIVIRGNAKTADWVIRREMKISEGELFSETKLQQSRQRLLNSGLFYRVELTSQQGPTPDQLDIEVQVEEVPRNFTLGFGPGAESALLGSLKLGVYNLFGRGQAFTLYWQGSITQNTFNVSFIEPRLFGSEVAMSLNGFGNTFFLPAMTWLESGGKVDWARAIKGSLWSYGGYLLSVRSPSILTRLDPVGSPTILNQNLPESLAFLGRRGELFAGLQYDTRDSREFTTKGWFLLAEGGASPEFLGAQIPMLRASGRVSKFFTLKPSPDQTPGGVMAHLTLRGDLLAPLEELDIAYPDRLLLGGIGSVRGFAIQSLGPRVGEEAPLVIGGTSAVSASAELDVPFFGAARPAWLRRIRWAAFVDTGNSFGSVFDPGVVLAVPQKDFGVLPVRTAVGVGLRWYTPWVTMRVEAAQPIDPQDGERFQLHFSMGASL